MNDHEMKMFEGRMTVIADSEIESIVPEFIKEWKEDVITMRHALDLGDYETIRSISHRMKGTGATCGFDALTALGTDLLECTKRMNKHAIAKLLDLLSSYLEKVNIVYQ